jgi:phosphopantothenoylcysteine synthetase/decarboxylase
MSDTKPKQEQPLKGRELLLCVTGGIACYKAADLTSRLVQAGAGVSVAMTEMATRFVTPLTFEALSQRPVVVSWDEEGEHTSPHIALTDRAELMIVAPATANILGKISAGIADDVVSTLALAATGTCRILAAPAMNTRMWSAASVRENVRTMEARGVSFVGPNEGRLACGTVGPGRMSEPEEIFAEVVRLLSNSSSGEAG